MPFRQTAAPDLPAGRYLGKLEKLEERHSDRFDSEFLIWHVRVAYGSDRVPVSGTTSVAWSPKSKAYGWASAAFGSGLNPKGPAPAYDEFVGRVVIVKVGPNENDWPTIEALEPYSGDRTGLVPFTARTDDQLAPVPAAAADAPPRQLAAAWPTASGKATAVAEPLPATKPAPDELDF
jgi:hypothetical protein